MSKGAWGELDMAGTHSAAALSSPSFGEKSLPSQLARQAALVFAGSVFVALCAHISIPLLFTPVPLTMQNFAVLLLGLLMEPVAVFASMLLYLMEGAAGLPVFTPHGPGGLLQMIGPSGGFLLAYPFVAAFVSLLSRRMQPASFASLALSGACASVLLYACGAGWFSVLSHLSFATTLNMTVLPFLAGDALKVFAAAAIAASLARFRRHRHAADGPA
jgi:biotin transport system substrate-specific component